MLIRRMQMTLLNQRCLPRYIAAWLCFSWLFVLPLEAQSFTVHLLNGHSGKPMTHSNLTFYWCPNCPQQETVVALGDQGSGTVKIPEGTTDFFVLAGPKMGKEPNRIAFIDCNSWPHKHISVEEIMKTGVTPRNQCSLRASPTSAGTLIFWGKPFPWWQLDFQ